MNICSRCGRHLTPKEAEANWWRPDPTCDACAYGALKELARLPTLEEFEELLKGHDWAFDFADSSREYHRGADEHRAIHRALKGYMGADRLRAEQLYEKYNCYARRMEDSPA